MQQIGPWISFCAAESGAADLNHSRRCLSFLSSNKSHTQTDLRPHLVWKMASVCEEIGQKWSRTLCAS